MTSKEILYLQDALNTEMHIIKKIDLYLKQTANSKLKTLYKKNLQKHINNYHSLLNVMK